MNIIDFLYHQDNDFDFDVYFSLMELDDEDALDWLKILQIAGGTFCHTHTVPIWKISRSFVETI